MKRGTKQRKITTNLITESIAYILVQMEKKKREVYQPELIK